MLGTGVEVDRVEVDEVLEETTLVPRVHVDVLEGLSGRERVWKMCCGGGLCG